MYNGKIIECSKTLELEYTDILAAISLNLSTNMASVNERLNTGNVQNQKVC